MDGVIHVDQKIPFPSYGLNLHLIGEERTFVQKKHTHTYYNGSSMQVVVTYSEHAGKEEVCNLVWSISKCPNDCAPAGQYTFPFQITLPEWLPGSFLLNVKKESALAQIKYFLVADFVPINDTDWANDDKMISSYSSSIPIQIVKPLMTIPECNLKQSMRREIGGFLGIGKSAFSAEILFEKNTFYNSDKIRLQLICDNSGCKKDVKEFKIKLFRRYLINTNGRWQYCGFKQNSKAVNSKKEEYVATGKFPGCKSKEVVTRNLELDLPNIDANAI